MILFKWAQRWQVPAAAILELQQLFGVAVIETEKPDTSSHSESAVLNRIKLEASRKGARLWRNNVGATYTTEGAFIRYGLANESAAMNKKIKSSDLIGIRPVRITSEMIGLVIGQFISREIKNANWRYTGTEREEAQLRWLNFIMSMGGDACFITKEGSL